jgi:GH24 family phage-related lysozyme (muramidase)
MTTAFDLIKRFEGCVLHPYQDAVGLWTIGYGCRRIKGAMVSPKTEPLTQEEAEGLLSAEIIKTRDQVLKTTKGPLSDNELAALTSFVFNLGLGTYAHSTLLKLLNAGDRAGAAAEFPKWVYAGGAVLPGLVKRRAAERELFETAPNPVP